jgi:outer membrane lipoprotein carrier protein
MIFKEGRVIHGYNERRAFTGFPQVLTALQRIVLGSCGMIICLCGVCAFGADVRDLARQVDEHYNQLRSLKADFTEIYSGTGAERTESGTLWLKKPGKMRWEYRSPKEKLFLSDGKQAWFYVPGDARVQKIPLKKLDDVRSPLAFLLGRTKLEKELDGLSMAPDIKPSVPGNSVLRGVPKFMADRVNEVMLEVNPQNEIARIIIDETDGSVTEYRFTDQRENAEVPDNSFRFAAPAGVEVVEGDLGP